MKTQVLVVKLINGQTYPTYNIIIIVAAALAAFSYTHATLINMQPLLVAQTFPCNCFLLSLTGLHFIRTLSSLSSLVPLGT